MSESTDIKPPFKVFVSTPDDYWLTPNQLQFKHKLIDKLAANGLDVQIMGEMGMPYSEERVWGFERTENVMKCCQGIVVIGMPRWYGASSPRGSNERRLITEFSHFEGAMAYTQTLPALMLAEAGVEQRGILMRSENTLVSIPPDADETFIEQDRDFKVAYDRWSKRVKDRYHLFFGYSRGAEKLAGRIIKALQYRGIRVRDWQKFKAAGTILEQISEADQTCLGGLFLFTQDDELNSKGAMFQAPRDNVVFEAGYFMGSKGMKKVLLIVESGTKLLDDVAGYIYVPLEDRKDIAGILPKIVSFVEDRVSSVT